jgi:hypothetical protein
VLWWWDALAAGRRYLRAWSTVHPGPEVSRKGISVRVEYGHFALQIKSNQELFRRRLLDSFMEVSKVFSPKLGEGASDQLPY